MTPRELPALERRVIEAVYARGEAATSLAAELVACDTTAREPADPPRDEEKLQRILERRLRSISAVIDLWEPEPIGADHPYLSAPLDFRGRPQLVARIPGAGGGRSLLLNGHIDAVDPGARERWTSDPFRPQVRDGCLWGRGSCDMKGGLASMVVAMEALHEAGVHLAGDVVFCSNTDEESSGVGAWTAIQHGVSADAGICAEPTGLTAFTACRGTTTGIISVEGRAGHAEMPQRDWREGGAVNAIEKLLPLVESVVRLRERWQSRPDLEHPLLSAGSIVPTIIQGGTWSVTFPESCSLTCDVQYLPAQVDEHGTGGAVQEEILQCVQARALRDPWLAEHPPRLRWLDDCPPAEVPPEHDIVTTVLGASRDVGRPGGVAGLDSWHDAATFTLLGDTPTISFGPGDIAVAHACDEHVSIDDLVDHAAAIALVMMRWCGVSR